MSVRFQFLTIFLCVTAFANLPAGQVRAQTYYVSQQNGSDANNGLSASAPFETVDEALDVLGPGDTLLFMGEFTNEGFDADYVYSNNIEDPYIWKEENTIRINNLNGSDGNYITLKAFDEDTILRGDGSNIFRVTNSSYLRIEDFEMVGIVDQVSLDTALALQFLYRQDGTPPTLYREQPGTPDTQVEATTYPALDNVKRPTYTDTRGIYFSNVHHIDFLNNEVHHTTGNGFRVQGCDYIKIIGNEVHNTSRKSYSGTHGMVVTNAESFDNSDDYKIFIQKNEIHHNYNEIYSWAPTKTIITPRIDEGKGISLQRNEIDDNDTPNNPNDDTGWTHGRMLIENNMTYWNGFSGIHSNNGLRLDFINNTSYFNSYTNTVTYADGDQNGKNIGASAQGGDDNKFINNVIFIDNAWSGFPISLANETNAEVKNNLVYGINGSLTQDSDVTAIAVGTIEGDPLFEDVEAFDFRLTLDSPAIGNADAAFSPEDDFFGFIRDANPDRGAAEFDDNLSVTSFKIAEISVYPNPFNDRLHIKTTSQIQNVQLFNFLGQEVALRTKISSQNDILDVSYVPSGVYFLRVNGIVKKLIKN